MSSRNRASFDYVSSFAAAASEGNDRVRQDLEGEFMLPTQLPDGTWRLASYAAKQRAAWNQTVDGLTRVCRDGIPGFPREQSEACIMLASALLSTGKLDDATGWWEVVAFLPPESVAATVPYLHLTRAILAAAHGREPAFAQRVKAHCALLGEGIWTERASAPALREFCEVCGDHMRGKLCAETGTTEVASTEETTPEPSARDRSSQSAPQTLEQQISHCAHGDTWSCVHACRARSSASCSTLAERLASGKHVKRDVNGATAALVRGCTSGDAKQCRRALSSFGDHGVRAELLRRACNDHDSSACAEARAELLADASHVSSVPACGAASRTGSTEATCHNVKFANLEACSDSYVEGNDVVLSIGKPQPTGVYQGCACANGGFSTEEVWACAEPSQPSVDDAPATVAPEVKRQFAAEVQELQKLDDAEPACPDASTSEPHDGCCEYWKAQHACQVRNDCGIGDPDRGAGACVD